MSHSRDASASSDVSDEGSRQYCKAITHNIAKTDDDLMFIKGDVIQIVDKISDSSWLVNINIFDFFFFSVSADTGSLFFCRVSAAVWREPLTPRL